MQVDRGNQEVPPAMREWAVKLQAKPKDVVSSTRMTERVSAKPLRSGAVAMSGQLTQKLPA
ncbi:hypothetical protein AB4Z46_16795 [Variovorax sp. M-6]|uniref:hypothetical protein n=1 Tax=Variovorax sp. M-6 TaxID=3233041 RepID=UPI003F9443A1